VYRFLIVRVFGYGLLPQNNNLTKYVAPGIGVDFVGVKLESRTTSSEISLVSSDGEAELNVTGMFPTIDLIFAILTNDIVALAVVLTVALPT
jgi:hypothetical protein